MANFNVHFAAAIVGGTVAANIGWAAGLWGGDGMLTVIALTTVGGLLPDIDAANSHSVRLLFNLFGLLGMVVTSTVFHGVYPWWLLMLCSGGVFLLVRYGLSAFFLTFSVHRGNCHSLAALVLSGAFTAAASYQLHLDAILAWGHALALMFGVLIHLILDEIYAIDFAGVRLKKSFGSAVKPFSRDKPLIGLGLCAAPMAVMPFMPPLDKGINVMRLLLASF